MLLPENSAFSQDNIVEHYDHVAEKYDEIYLSLGYYDHLKCLEIAEKFVPEEKRKDSTVFDMGCGTGLVGEVMQPKGWN